MVLVYVIRRHIIAHHGVEPKLTIRAWWWT